MPETISPTELEALDINEPPIQSAGELPSASAQSTPEKQLSPGETKLEELKQYYNTDTFKEGTTVDTLYRQAKDGSYEINWGAGWKKADGTGNTQDYLDRLLHEGAVLNISEQGNGGTVDVFNGKIRTGEGVVFSVTSQGYIFENHSRPTEEEVSDPDATANSYLGFIPEFEAAEQTKEQESATRITAKAKRPFWAEWLANTPTYEIDTKETTLTELFPATVVTLHHDQPSERATEEVLQAIETSQPGTEVVVTGLVDSPTHEVTDAVILRRGEVSTHVEYQFIDRPHAEAFPLNEHWEAPSGTARPVENTPERAASLASAAEPAVIDVTARVRQSLPPAPVITRQVLAKKSVRSEFGAELLAALQPVSEHTDSSRRSFQAEPPPAPTPRPIDHYSSSPPTPESNNETKIAVPPKPDTFRYYVISKGQPRPVIESGVSAQQGGDSTGVDHREAVAAPAAESSMPDGDDQTLRSETLIKSLATEAPHHEPRRVPSFVRNDSISSDAKHKAAPESPRQLIERIKTFLPVQPTRAVPISSPGHERPVAVHQSPLHTMSSSPYRRIDTSVQLSAAPREYAERHVVDGSAEVSIAIASQETPSPAATIAIEQQPTASPSQAAPPHRELIVSRSTVRDLPTSQTAVATRHNKREPAAPRGQSAAVHERSTRRLHAAEEREAALPIERSTPTTAFLPEQSALVPPAFAQKESLPPYRRIDASVQPPAAASDAPRTPLADTPASRLVTNRPPDSTQRRRTIDDSVARQSSAAERVRQPVTVHPIVHDDQAIAAAPSTAPPRRARQAVKRQVA